MTHIPLEPPRSHTEAPCLCLLADVYGFSARVALSASQAHTDLVKLQAAIHQIVGQHRALHPDATLRSFFFSDTLLVTEAAGQRVAERLETFFMLCERIYLQSVKVDLPLRGCVTYGSVAIEADAIVGRPLIDAASLEKSIRVPVLVVPELTLGALASSGIRAADAAEHLGRATKFGAPGDEVLCYPLTNADPRTVAAFARAKIADADAATPAKVVDAWRRVLDITGAK